MRRTLLVTLLLALAACSDDTQTARPMQDMAPALASDMLAQDMDTDVPPDMPAPPDMDAPDQDAPDLDATDQDTPDLDPPDLAPPDMDAPDPCLGVSCSMHGACAVTLGAASCMCDPGYTAQGTRCVGAEIVLAAGDAYACAIKSGALFCWGDNGHGQLGDGTITPSTALKTPVGLDADVSGLGLGNDHGCAIKAGALYCWGSNARGQLGDGTTTRRTTPVAVSGMSSGVSAVAAGANHTCAVKDHALYCWGDNYYGQLGAGPTQTMTRITTPQIIPSHITVVTAIGAGDTHTCAIKAGAVSCWGFNDTQRLGAADTSALIGEPSPISGLDAAVSALGVGSNHTCAIKDDALYCWGEETSALGMGAQDAAAGKRVTPAAMDTDVTAVASGTYHTCAIKSGALRCWGANESGQLPGVAPGDYDTPQPANLSALAIAAGTYFTCAVLPRDAVQCWGDDGNNQRGGQPAFSLP